jgi:hypothetical protein
MRWPWVFLRPGDVAAIAIAVALGAGFIVFAAGSPHALDRNHGFGPGWDCQRDFCVKRSPANSGGETAPANHQTVE